jgi:hypothetical protein
MIKNKKAFIRRTHRYLGFFIGIQFLGWTISGLYFSWNDLDDVHGDHLRKAPHFLSADIEVVSPSVIIGKIKSRYTVDSIHSVPLINVAGRPVYQVAFFSSGTAEDLHKRLRYVLGDATTGELRDPLTKEEAVAIALDNVRQGAIVSQVNFLENITPHDEYREKPLPAWVVDFEEPDCTVYVSAQLGTFQSIRHNQWRVFDFLWMFHTMDYQGRDDFNNWLLKTFSFFGLLTVVSGFVLFFVSLKTVKTKVNRLKEDHPSTSNAGSQRH